MNKLYTVNTLLCLEKSLKSRLVQLKELTNESTKRTMWMDRLEPQKIEEPTYDIKKVDEKVVKLTRALFDIDMRIKEVNAKTKVELENFDYDDLMAAIT